MLDRSIALTRSGVSTAAVTSWLGVLTSLHTLGPPRNSPLRAAGGGIAWLYARTLFFRLSAAAPRFRQIRQPAAGRGPGSGPEVEVRRRRAAALQAVESVWDGLIDDSQHIRAVARHSVVWTLAPPASAKR
jgi:hypothetical protein